MLWKTHLVGGLIAGALVAPYSDMSQVAFIACAGASALLPDIDTPNSKLGSLIYPVSTILRSTVGHRGLLHSLLIPILLYVCILSVLPALALPIAVGYLSHILLDMLTPEGVPLFWPLSFRVSIPLIQTGGIVERVLFYPFVAYFGVIVSRIL